MKYLDDAYAKELKTRIAEVGKDYLVLSDSIFHPQGGGQPADKGWVNDVPVKDVLDNKVFIDVKGFKAGDIVSLRLDWSYRYALMKAHTAEHLFFSCLSRTASVLLEKIDLTDRVSSLFVKGSVSFDDLLKAENLMIDLIAKDLPVTAVFSNDLANVRMHADKIKGEIRVVSIGDLDKSACTGTHLKRTGEIGFFLVTGFNAPGRIDFMVGDLAEAKALDNSGELIKLCYAYSVSPDKLPLFVNNLVSDRDSLRDRIKSLGNELLSSKKFTPVNGFIIEQFTGLENDKLIRLASELSKDANIVFLNDANLIVSGISAETIFNKLIQA